MADYDRASGNRPSIYGELDRAGIFDREGDEGVDEPTDDPTPTVVGNEIADNTLGVLDYDTLAAALDATLSLFNVPEEFRDSIATNISNVAPLWTHDGSILDAESLIQRDPTSTLTALINSSKLNAFVLVQIAILSTQIISLTDGEGDGVVNYHYTDDGGVTVPEASESGTALWWQTGGEVDYHVLRIRNAFNDGWVELVRYDIGTNEALPPIWMQDQMDAILSRLDALEAAE